MCRRSAIIALLFIGVASLGFAAPAVAESEHASSEYTFQYVFSVLEIPFLVGCVVFAFLTAGALKGGQFGTGMLLLAWGFLVMAVGHIHMQLESVAGFSLFDSLFGDLGGSAVWVLALILTWCLSAAGFYQMYRASK